MWIKRHHEENIREATNLAKIIVTSIPTKDKEPLKARKNKTKKRKKENWQNT